MYDATVVESMIQRYLDAEVSLLDGKTVTFAGRTWTAENLNELRSGRLEWERKLTQKRRRSRPLLSNFSR
jgi:hypothetical protein